MAYTVENITHRCGHEEELEVTYHGNRDLKTYLWQQSQSLCDECRQAQQARWASMIPQPLAGTPKQITWATDIRTRVARDISVTPGISDGARNAAVAALAAYTDARWWIDHRHESAWRLIRLLGLDPAR